MIRLIDKVSVDTNVRLPLKVRMRACGCVRRGQCEVEKEGVADFAALALRAMN